MSEARLRPWRGGRVLLVSIVVGAALLLLAREAIDLYVEVLWFGANGYLDVFWTRALSRWGVRIVVMLVVGAMVYANVRLFAVAVRALRIRRRFANLEISEKIPDIWITRGTLVLSVLAALWFGTVVPPEAGLALLLLLRAPAWGVTDPVLGHDLSFYIFALPVMSGIVAFALLLIFFLFSLSIAVYAATGALRLTRSGIGLEDLARRHLTLLVTTFLVLLAVRFQIARYILLLDGNSDVQGLFGFTDAVARLPALTTLVLVALGAAGLVAWGGARRKVVPTATGLGAIVVGTLVLAQLYPATVQRFRVEPNELESETPYIEHNLEFTRMGFGLDRLQRERFDYRGTAGGTGETSIAAQFAGLPVWTPGALLSTYRQLEARFRYYEFSDVTIDRYRGPNGLVPVALAVREIEPGGIEDRNWQNLHIRERYIAGMGAVASAAEQHTPEGRPSTILSAIPPEFAEGVEAPDGLRLVRPSVFFGVRPQAYAIINPTADAFLDPQGEPGQAGVDYPEGILLDSWLRKLLLALRFRDANLLFASEVASDSRFVFRRQVTERARDIAPFLRFPEPAYPVVDEGRVVWMLDAFTATRHFPLASAYELEGRSPVSYVRNSVKVTVDGVTGRIAFYIADENDILLEGYRRTLPELFQPLSAMPPGLREHIRYPRELLTLQGRVLFQYHLETAPSFHGQEDVWAPATELAEGTNPVPYRPEYGIYSLPGEQEPEYLLSTAFVPAGRQNLTALLVARSDGEHYGELLLYDVPVEEQVPGPRLVEALVEQDPSISQQLSLWRQGGSEVWTGHLHIVPVDGTLMYMEPIFLAAESDAIPELRQFVVSDGRRVAMQPTLNATLAALAAVTAPEETFDTTDLGELRELAADTSAWPGDALDLLDRAEEALRAGDFAGFGARLRELRDLLEQVEDGAGS